MKIHLPAYPRGVHQIQETLTAEELDLDPQVFVGPIDVDVKLDRHDPYLELNFDIRAAVSSQCDLCLVDYDWTLIASGPMLYVLGRQPAGDAVDDPGIVYLPANATTVDLTADIRDLVILALPGKHICREDCQGLCPGCGVDLNMQQCTCGESAS